MNFRGVLVRLDEPSDKAPNGSEGHRIMVPASVAKSRLSTLIGMGLNYSKDLNVHAQRHKVGVIKKAWIEGKDLCVEGVIWKHDFPEVERDLKKPGLGMSMELGDVSVADPSAQVWTLNDFSFLGATILYKRSAAYHKTQAIAAQADERNNMKVTKKTAAKNGGSDSKVVELAASAAAEAVATKLQPTLIGLSKGLVNLQTRFDQFEIERIAAGNGTVAAAAEEEVDEVEIDAAGEEEEVEIAAGKKQEEEDDEDDDEDDDMESAIDKGGLADMGPDTKEAVEGDKPGELNKGTKNKGDKTTSEDALGNKVTDGGITGSAEYRALVKQNRTLAAQVASLTAQVGKLMKANKKQHAQIKAAAEVQERRSLATIDPMTAQLLAKSNVDARELTASGQPLTVEQVDQIIATGMPEASVQDRMKFKNTLLQSGLMEQGSFTRQ